MLCECLRLICILKQNVSYFEYRFSQRNWPDTFNPSNQYCSEWFYHNLNLSKSKHKCWALSTANALKGLIIDNGTRIVPEVDVLMKGATQSKYKFISWVISLGNYFQNPSSLIEMGTVCIWRPLCSVSQTRRRICCS